MSDFSNIATSTTASSSTTSLVIPSESSSIDGIPFSSPYTPTNDAQSVNGDATTSSESLAPQVDPQILEALRSKDRIYVLKLGEIMEELIMEKKPRADLTAATSYQRLLLHRCSAYYRLQIDVDPVSKGISAVVIAESCIPLQRLADLVPPEPTPQPAFKIMQRSPHERRVKPQSHAGSVTGEDADSSDIEPSEAGSIGGRSSATGGSTRQKRMTMEEREAAYNEARSRIFMGFDEKKEKDKDMSASSSSLSLASSSAGGSSLGDAEDSPPSLATESERSGPSFNRKDSRKPNPSVKSSGPRSLRPSAQPFTSNPNGSGSSRNSPAPSPSFTYAPCTNLLPLAHSNLILASSIHCPRFLILIRLPLNSRILLLYRHIPIFMLTGSQHHQYLRLKIPQSHRCQEKFILILPLRWHIIHTCGQIPINPHYILPLPYNLRPLYPEVLLIPTRHTCNIPLDTNIQCLAITHPREINL
ncbi:hypothetical protein BT96DRAFT_688224 [Gymnopus androsaceus JB14]|uniref:SUZ domain-containing protein n=1 Tax=Gymnopus androsaceus JB14 TaxID=1447944 RepID=A0A6A4HRH8_9AGAR|nr:hypothetical protein BT96DRAFT_688224 [Gymnopus androsaceus JB14]